jgi:hypothetical protein
MNFCFASAFSATAPTRAWRPLLAHACRQSRQRPRGTPTAFAMWIHSEAFLGSVSFRPSDKVARKTDQNLESHHNTPWRFPRNSEDLMAILDALDPGARFQESNR